LFPNRWQYALMMLGGRLTVLKRITLLAVVWLSVSVAGPGQAQETDSQTLHKILAELRAIHEDMRVTETTQLLVAELQMQQGVVNRATEKSDDARMRLSQIHLDQQHAAVDADHAQEQLDKSSSADERNALAQDIERQKSNLAALKTAERDQNQTVLDAEQRLQSAKEKLESIESELSAAISRLGPVSKDTGQR
jgi:hypothetical protein